MNEMLRNADELTRRGFVTRTAKQLLGLSLLPTLAPVGLFGQQAAPKARKHARKVIYLYMSGGMSHLDTFDPKADKDVKGPVEAIKTNVPGIEISEHFNYLARQMDKVAIVRTLSSTQGAHEQGNYFMHSSYTMRGTIQHPGLGAWLHRLDGRTNNTLPASVCIGSRNEGASAGFLESKFAPLFVGDPNGGIQYSKRRSDMSEQEMRDRLLLSQAFDSEFHKSSDQKHTRAYKDAYDDAMRLMKSEDLKAFDLNLEPGDIREEYGQNSFGQGCLLARRLIENDVRFAEVTLGGWDTHSRNFPAVEDRAKTLDTALGALLNDLERRGLLEETLIVVATEFGRTPKINEDEGRDHYPRAFSCLLAGGGIKGGQVHGKTDKTGSMPEENPVLVPDFNATIAAALGLPLDEVVFSPSKRPFKVADKGRPIEALLA